MRLFKLSPGDEPALSSIVIEIVSLPFREELSAADAVIVCLPAESEEVDILLPFPRSPSIFELQFMS